jgi:hypothetical protein
MNEFVLEALWWLPYIYYRKLMQAHQEFIEDLIYV